LYTIDLFDAAVAPELIGNKAASLVQLNRIGFRVPRGVCVTTEAHRDWLLAGMLTPDLRGALLGAFRRLQSPVAVRSSSPSEDLPDASYAGQYTTVLGVATEEDLLAAVETCWRSAASAAAVAYRTARGGEANVEMAVLIQELVPADTAGVLFTMNPVTERLDQIVINANFGLGESVVSGHAEPDTFILSKESTEVVESRVGTKRVATRPQVRGVAEMPLDVLHQESLSLSPRQLEILAAAARRLEAHYDGPMDAEWAFVGDELHLLQARPVTTGFGAYAAYLLDRWARDRNLKADPDTIWVRGSVLSGLRISPLYYSEMSAFFADMFVEIARLYRAPAIRRKIFHYHNGFTYTDAEFSSTADPPGAIKPESPFGPAWRANLKIALRHPRSLAFWRNIDYYNRRWQRDWRPGIEAHRPDFAKATPEAIREFIEYMEVQRRERSIVAGLAVGYAPNFLGLLTYLLARWAPGIAEDELGVLTSGLDESLTHDENVELWLLAEGARRRPAVCAALLAGEFACLPSLPEGPAFLAEADAFRLRHAHRGCSDRDIFQPRWGDDQVLLLNQVKLMLALGADADPRTAHARTAVRRAAAERAVLARIRGPLGPLRRRILMLVLRTTQRYVMHRDNQRHTFEPYFLELRRAYGAIGEQLVRRGLLSRSEDIFFLGKTEIYDYIDGKLADDRLQARAAARRRWWERVTQAEPPSYLRNNRPYDRDVSAVAGAAFLTGAAGAPGVATGPARIIRSLQELERIRPGDIVVTYAIDPAWTPVFGIIGGVISVEGGMLAHAAVLGREYGLPVVLAARNATTRLHDGDIVRIDGTSGAIALVQAAAADAESVRAAG
jgi:phosphohistidine swiveling domain-containing protein